MRSSTSLTSSTRFGDFASRFLAEMTSDAYFERRPGNCFLEPPLTSKRLRPISSPKSVEPESEWECASWLHGFEPIVGDLKGKGVVAGTLRRERDDEALG